MTDAEVIGRFVGNLAASPSGNLIRVSLITFHKSRALRS
jgi:hypothetical protein